MKRQWEVIAFVVASLLMVVMLALLARALNDQPTCAERGGTPTTYQGSEACLVPGGIIGRE